MLIKRIALYSRAAGGKTTQANLLAEEFGHTVIPLAKPLKMIAEELLGRKINKGTDRLFLIDLGKYIKNPKQENIELINFIQPKPIDIVPKFELFQHKFEQAMIKTGLNEFNRDKDIFVNWLINEVDKYDSVIIDDLRFWNEVHGVQKVGFKLVHLHCEFEECIRRLKKRDGKNADTSFYNTRSENEHFWFRPDIRVNATQGVEEVYKELVGKLNKYEEKH
jgi:dephospho-CoA kinase